ncbi:MAG: DMT family transporter [Clostridia bacterium]
MISLFTLLSILAGVLTALSVAQNGQLAGFYGNYSATVMIHVVGLVTVLFFRVLSSKKLPPKQATKPWMFMGGMVGVATTVFINQAYGGVSVTAIIGLGLLGQILTSIAVDHFGLLGANRSPFFAKRLYEVAVVVLGAVIMLLPFQANSWLAVLMALCSGVTIVIARTINGKLATRQGALRSTVMNYVTGLLTGTVMMLLLGRGEPIWVTGFQASSNVFMYLGGAAGVGLIMILNMTVHKIPAFALTMLQFTGQIFTGLLLDALAFGKFSWQSAVGGLLVAVGLCLDSYFTKAKKKQAVPLAEP